MKKMDWEIDLSIARALTWRYTIALLLIASLSTAAWLSLHLVISEQKSTAAIVNISGRQRMLSQRTALFSNLLIITPKAQRTQIRSQLTDAIELMEHSHQALTNGDDTMGLPRNMSLAVHALYFDGQHPLDEQIDNYVKAVQTWLLVDDDALMADNSLLLYITEQASNTLLTALDQ